MPNFPFDDVLRLEAEEEALPDIPDFPTIYGQTTITRDDTGRDRRRTVAKTLFPTLWVTP